MPVLPEPAGHHTVTLPPRSARHGGRCDVLVVGGGPAGSAAALAAAWAGWCWSSGAGSSAATRRRPW
ncbi:MULTISPECIES: hypothetical protein [Streptomyces]|jgi:hypothetical protein|uniref:FAD-dependent oxidoreductase n=1 Tax=Streptomyces griseoviridis TaxID=45398 RepID=A0ABT9LQG8_STRGD|nr:MULTISPECIES: hypothetical protein [Streptomyces]MDP9685789.1 hypothetical protein [Streptomyces griseoviridis]